VTLRVRTVPYGREAALVLRDELAAAQADDPLAPVTVVVPRNLTGLAVRRLLASGDLGPPPGGGRPGVVNVTFTTTSRLAEDIAGADLAAAGVSAAGDAVLRAAARGALAASPERSFAAVADHPATARALVATYRDLQGVPAPSREAMAATSGRAASVLAAVGHMEDLLGDRWTDVGRRTERAVDLVRQGAGGSDPVVVYLPPRLSLHDERLVVALAGNRPVVVVVGLTGDPTADSTAVRIVDRLGRVPGAVIGATGGPDPTVPRGTSVVSAPTADAEVRIVAREVMRRAVAGVRFERMAVVHGGSGVYERLVRETLASAGIPYHWVGGVPLSDTVPGRLVLGLFELADDDWPRDGLVAWLAAAPVLDGREPAPVVAWDLVSRAAGVVAGREDWRRHLEAFADDREAAVAGLDRATDGPPSGRAAVLRREVRLARSLAAFVERLATRFAEPPLTWAGWAAWVGAVLDDLLGRPSDRDDWPTEAEEALEALRGAVDGLAVLDGFAGPPDRGAFRQALVAELDGLAPQTTKFGNGVLVAPVEALGGLDLDAVFVVGLVDGAFPGRAADDALLPDRERAEGGDDVPLRSTRNRDAGRDYLAALAAADERILSTARGDQRRGREQRPSRWLLDTLGALAGTGRRLFSGDLDDLGEVQGFRTVPSYTAAVRDPGEPLSLADRDLRMLVHWADSGRPLAGHPLAAPGGPLARSLAARAGRRGHGFTRFDGLVGPGPSLGGGAVSATSLETYAQCPRRHLMERVLRIGVADRPEDVPTISSADRGTLVHTVLERFFARQLARPRDRRIGPGERWSAEDHGALEAIAVEEFAAAEERGLVGRPLLWRQAAAAILRDLHRFLVEDDRFRAEHGVVPEEAELRFGPGHGRPVTLRLSDGRDVAFKGMVDRVDRSADGALAVLDYKTGSAYGVEGIDDDPVVRGTKLQLPLYALAAQGRLGAAPTYAAYWFISEKGKFERVGTVVGPAVLDRCTEVVATLVDGIEGGRFPARPGPKESNCTYCAYQPLCPARDERPRAWERVRDDPGLAQYVALAEGDPGAGPAEAS